MRRLDVYPYGSRHVSRTNSPVSRINQISEEAQYKGEKGVILRDYE